MAIKNNTSQNNEKFRQNGDNNVRLRQAMLIGVTIGAAGSAQAQGSVTLYGLIDTGINFVNDAQSANAVAPNGRTGGKQVQVTSGVLRSNRWGIMGKENLGGGYTTIFTLEDGFDVDSGKFLQGGDLFGRQAFVGIVAPWGKVTLGRQYDLFTEYLGPFQGSAYTSGFGDHPDDIDNLADSFRANNSIKYTSPVFAGFSFGVMLGLGGVAGNFAQNSFYSVGASYARGPLNVGFGYFRVRNPNQSWWGNQATSSTTGNNLGPVTGVTSNPVMAGFASARNYQVIGGAAQYVVGPVTLGFNYSNISFQDLNYGPSGTLAQTNPENYTGTATFNSYSLVAQYQFAPTLSLNFSYDYLTGGSVNGRKGAKYNEYTALLDYYLSKRTDVYLAGAFQTASGIDSTGQAAVASMVTATPSNGPRQVIGRVGIRHLF